MEAPGVTESGRAEVGSPAAWLPSLRPAPSAILQSDQGTSEGRTLVPSPPYIQTSAQSSRSVHAC